MVFVATGKFTEPEKLAPLLAEEVRKVHSLRNEGIVVGAYRRADRSGVVLILEIANLKDVQDRLAQLPFAKAGLLKFDYVEVEPF